MQRLTQKLQVYCLYATGLLVVLKVILFLLLQVNYHKEVAAFDKKMKPGDVEKTFAHMDGQKPTEENGKPYAMLLDKMVKQCFESRSELALMMAALTKAERKHIENMTHKEVMEGFLDQVNSGFERHPANCKEVYSYNMRGLKES